MRSTTAGKLLLVTVSIVVVLGAFEVVLRALDLRVYASPNWTFHEILGWTQMPLRRSEHTVKDGDRISVEINSLGFRTAEATREKPAGTKRIVAIGDSFTEAIQVNVEETYGHLLAKGLSAEGDASWETVALGTGDWGTAQELLALEHFGLTYDPDLVVLQIFPLNDLCNNAMELEGLCKSGNDVVRPYFVLEEGELVAAHTQPVFQFFRKTSLTFRLLDGFVRYWHHQSDPPAERKPDPARLRKLGLGELPPLLYTYVPGPDQPEVIRRAWQVTEALFERIVEACREYDVPLVVVIAPFEVRVTGRWEAFASGQPPPDLERDYADRRIEAFFEERGVPVVALRPFFEDRLGEVLPFRGGHWNPGGHRVVAEVLLDAVREHAGDRLEGRQPIQ